MCKSLGRARSPFAGNHHYAQPEAVFFTLPSLFFGRGIAKAAFGIVLFFSWVIRTETDAMSWSQKESGRNLDTQTSFEENSRFGILRIDGGLIGLKRKTDVSHMNLSLTAQHNYCRHCPDR
jgi:hypothetical protein